MACLHPFCNLGRKFEHKKRTKPYCFLLFINFGQENGLILSGEIFLLVFITLKIFGPPFQNPAYASDCACRSYMPLLRNRCLFFCNGNRIANRIGAYFSKRSHQIIASNHAKESTSIIASENSTKKSVIFVIIFDGSVSS